MPRRLFTLASTLSLLLCAATCALWARSYLPQRLWLHFVDGRLLLVGAEGATAVELRPFLDPAPAGKDAVRAFPADVRSGRSPVGLFAGNPSPGSLQWPQPPAARRRAVLGIEVTSVASAGWSWPGFWAVSVPLAYSALAAAAAPAWWMLRRRRGPQRVGSCPTCGYDLTANASGVCPECGSPTRGAA